MSATEPRGRRKNNKPWKHIYGVDRRYTARVNRLAERASDEDAIDNVLLTNPDPTDPETHEGEPA